jgi:hypothetical protein
MTVQNSLTDDPTSYLKRDATQPCIMLAGSLLLAQDTCARYGVSIQCKPVIGNSDGILVVSNQADAVQAVATVPATTLWCVIADGLTDQGTRDILKSWLGNPTTIANALGVSTEGIAWRPDKFPVF